MKRPFFVIVVFLITAAFNVQAYGQPSTQNAISVERPWARATPAGAKTGAAYMTLVNKGASADRLVSATTSVAEKVKFHSVSEENGISRMREMRSVDVAPGKNVTFSPGGMHIMLVGLKKPLKEGESVPMTLIFEKGGKVDVMLSVARVGAMQPGPMMREPSDSMKR
jgi:copper(I)-binding protein